MNKLSTQVVAFLVLLVITLGGVLVVTNSDIDTDVKTADTSVLALSTNDSTIDFSISYPAEWQAAATADGLGYVFTLKEPLSGIAEEAQPQIEITVQNIPYADKLASTQAEEGEASLVEYETVDNHRSGVRYSNTESLPNGQQVVTETTILNPQDLSATNEVTETRTVVARLIADSNRIGDYQATVDLMLTSLEVSEPFILAARGSLSAPELTQTYEIAEIGLTYKYPEDWVVQSSPENPLLMGISSPDGSQGFIIQLIALPEGATLQDLVDSFLQGQGVTTIIEPLSSYSVEAGEGVSVTYQDPVDGNSYVDVTIILISDTELIATITSAPKEQFASLRSISDAILASVTYVPPVFEVPQTPEETPTEEATPAAEETPAAEPTEVPTEVPTEAPTVEATPAN